MTTEHSDPVNPGFPHSGDPLSGTPAAAESSPPETAEQRAAPGAVGSASGNDAKGKGVEHLDAVKHTRTGATWTAIIFGTLLLIVLLIFIVQNGEPTKVVFLSWDVSLPLGVLMLAAAIIGVLGTALVGAARMFQVWRAARKSHKA
ncbi:conserved hypothetical protein [Segniliparus rotundus DSM 44985]|uniref:Lipopolysaccharide assembly protein A domain-containing protein n=1 Tax=Segniliparus rotundus (strain ATCC BAA-972 / CDC 1076 / CIP 108378 / DSM 44985 / JCM 13578) TaxID=640132 RepID=D6ZAG5_SEGRD|nr:lipopolysaccharide assembly protein LapA domain-containing protein [Segniliparus rotundus]ADG96707.1 conserved hypothetical protein [Segniliparus rotundus DSM 44985]